MSTLPPLAGHYVLHVHDEGEACDRSPRGCSYRLTWLTRLRLALSLRASDRSRST